MRQGMLEKRNDKERSQSERGVREKSLEVGGGT